MADYLWLIPLFPFAGFLLLSLAGRAGIRQVCAAVGVGSVACSAVAAIAFAVESIAAGGPGARDTTELWQWAAVPGFRPVVLFWVDALSLVFILVVTIVGFLIHLYAASFMRNDDQYRRFFAYMNLFVGFMLVLVMAGNLLLLYLGWEGVGLCSYLLIGFWYREPANGVAAQKAFIVTRIGDTALSIALFILLLRFGTLDIAPAMRLAESAWSKGAFLPVLVASLVLAGALGKSAQLPLQTWLPDAMAGPTPVSALIHAATMVTAGVYLVARLNVLFALAPVVSEAIAAIGAVTLLVAGMSALVQTDLKRILAYSTISQVGYMFLALGIGAWSAAIFHFVTHAFFKALLFLGAGVVIASLGEEHNIFKMGGLRRRLPLTFWTFLIGACSLAALPLVTAGFYSKDLILMSAWTSPRGDPLLWTAGTIGAFLTALYTFRMVFVVFFGRVGLAPLSRPGMVVSIPLIVLAFFSLTAGCLDLPSWIADFHPLADFLHDALPAAGYLRDARPELPIQLMAPLVSLAGVLVAWFAYRVKPELLRRVTATAPLRLMTRYFFADWGFDWLYDRLFVFPYRFLARIGRNDLIDILYRAIAGLGLGLNRALSATQNGELRWYMLWIALGAVFFLGMVLLL